MKPKPGGGVSETTNPSTSKFEEELTTQQTPLVQPTNPPATQSPIQPSTEGAPPPKSTPETQVPTEPTPDPKTTPQKTPEVTPEPTMRIKVPTQPSTENIVTSSNKIDEGSRTVSTPSPVTDARNVVSTPEPTTKSNVAAFATTAEASKPRVSYINLCLLSNMHSPIEY
jgi:hypothetical protein